MAIFQVTNDILERLCAYSNYPLPDRELVFFGIRGALPESSQSTALARTQAIRTVDLDYQRMRCSLGQWHRAAGTLALFPGSTVPSLPNIQRARENGGAGANQLMPGRYKYEIGRHKDGKPSGHRAFRQASFFPVRRTRNNTSYDNFDEIDFGTGNDDFVFDNLHSAYHDTTESGYSSAGCQVVCGLPSSPSRGNAPETGPWRDFVHNAYTVFAPQKVFPYYLFTANDLATVAEADPKKIITVVKFGSEGAVAKAVQKALVATGDLAELPDSKFGRKSLQALVRFQERKFGKAATDGVCGPVTAAMLGVTMPSLADTKSGTITDLQADVAAASSTDMVDETDLAREEVARLLSVVLGTAAPATPATPVATLPPPAPADAPAAQFSLDRFFRLLPGTPFTGTPSAAQKDGMAQVIEASFRLYPNGDPRWLAYILASIFHETGQMMVPVREGFKQTDSEAREHVKRLCARRHIADYAEPVNGISYFGRGRVQNTHLENYRKLSTRFSRDFVNHPELLLDPAIDAEVSVVGHVEGIWTGRRLDEFITGDRADYVGARRIVNGQDRAAEIAGYARDFEAAVAAAMPAIDTSALAAGLSVLPATPGFDVIGDRGGDDVNTSEIAAIAEAVRRLEQQILGVTGAGTADNAVTPILTQVQEIDSAIKSLSQAKAPLTPVNAALGQTIGSLLNGKKSVIGIFGALAAALASGAPAGGPAAQMSGAVTSLLPFLTGASGPLLPVFIALTAWGFLGKVEKMIVAGDIAQK